MQINQDMKQILFTLLFAMLCTIASAQHYYRSDTLTNSQNDTAVVIVGADNSAAIEIEIDVVSGTPTADLKVEGSVSGNVWYDIYSDPETTGTPTKSAITIDSEDAVFVPGDGYSGTTQLSRPFKFLRLITIQTGTGTATYRYSVLTL